MRVCNKNTCPVGIATQNKELRKNFTGKPEYIVNFMRFVAMEMREIMAKLGFKTIDDMIGRTDKLKQVKLPSDLKASKVDLKNVLYSPFSNGKTSPNTEVNDIYKSFDYKSLLQISKQALLNKQNLSAKFRIHNTDRVVGTMLGSQITRQYGNIGLEKDITINLLGSAGQSFGAFIPKGLNLILEGDANDYLGKGLSGGTIIVKPEPNTTFDPAKNIIIGNVALYGATSGKAFINGLAGERFAVRNSGVEAVVEGVGDHGCEYMTGGKVIILGEIGHNFAAGMSGGIAYVYNFDDRKCNKELVSVLDIDETDKEYIMKTLDEYITHTSSTLAKTIKSSDKLYHFKKIIPYDYKRIVDEIELQKQQGLNTKQATKIAFEKVTNEEVA